MTQGPHLLVHPPVDVIVCIRPSRFMFSIKGALDIKQMLRDLKEAGREAGYDTREKPNAFPGQFISPCSRINGQVHARDIAGWPRSAERRLHHRRSCSSAMRPHGMLGESLYKYSAGG